MSDDGFTPPSRERFREERRALRAADRRRKMLGIPIVTAGILLVIAGVYVFTNGDGGNGVDTDVSGVSIVRTTTTTSTTTTSTTTSTTTTTLPPTTTVPPTTVKPKPKPKPTTSAPPATVVDPAVTAPPA